MAPVDWSWAVWVVTPCSTAAFSSSWLQEKQQQRPSHDHLDIHSRIFNYLGRSQLQRGLSNVELLLHIGNVRHHDLAHVPLYIKKGHTYLHFVCRFEHLIRQMQQQCLQCNMSFPSVVAVLQHELSTSGLPCVLLALGVFA